jgi:glycosyltransferase involved in cell wall biosynthesis
VKPLVSVITPTYQRHERLLNRCIPSVQAQVYPKTEHVIVSDGPDPALAEKIARLHKDGAFYHPVRFVQLPERVPGQHWGHYARLAGIEHSGGAFLAYIDDDDALRPQHCAKLAALFENSTVGWAFSLMESHSNSGLSTHIGVDPPQCGQLGTPMIMHRRETLEYGTWGPESSVEDWELVSRWITAGIPHAFLPEPTVDVWPSAYWHHE